MQSKTSRPPVVGLNGCLFKSPIIVVDTETTGFPGSEWAEVIEIGAVVIDRDGDERDTFECLIHPVVMDWRIDAALKVNHLTRDMLTRMGLPPDEARALFGKWVREMGTPFITAYNVPFDRAMLDRGQYAEGLRWCTCIQRASRDYMGMSLKLGEVAEWFGADIAEPAHRALSDARTAARVMVALRRTELEEVDHGA